MHAIRQYTGDKQLDVYLKNVMPFAPASGIYSSGKAFCGSTRFWPRLSINRWDRWIWSGTAHRQRGLRRVLPRPEVLHHTYRGQGAPDAKIAGGRSSRGIGCALKDADDKCACSQPCLGVEATRGILGAADREPAKSALGRQCPGPATSAAEQRNKDLDQAPFDSRLNATAVLDCAFVIE